MNKVSFRAWGLFLSLIVLTVFSCQTDSPADPSPATTRIPDSLKASVSSPYLLEPAVVAQAINNNPSGLQIIEISKPEEYSKGHLPNAHSLWRSDYEGKGYAYGGMRMSRTELAELLGSLGIQPQDSVLLYDAKGNSDAIRFWWMLHLYGHQKAFVMNGGKKAWTMDEYELSKATNPTPEAIAYTFPGPENHSRLASKEDLLAALKDTSYVIVDTREPEEYKGVPYEEKGVCYPYKKGAFTYGRIANAIHLNWSDAVDLNGDHRLKSLRDLRYNFEQAGITPDKKIIAYCQSGVRSAHTTFVLTEILGYPEVRNYDGSWIEWSYGVTEGEDLPIEQDLDEDTHRQWLARLEASLRKPVQ